MDMAGIPRIEPYPLPSSAALPSNVAGWTLDPMRAALLIHDMQEYFVRPFADEMAERLVDTMATVLDRCRAAGMPVAYSMQPGGMTAQQRGLLADFWGMGMGADPADRDIVKLLAPQSGDGVFTKVRYSAFFRSGLLEWLRSHDRDQLIVCGVYGHVGILATAVDAFMHDIQTFLVSDAVGDFSARHHMMSMTYAAERCAVVTDSTALLP